MKNVMREAGAEFLGTFVLIVFGCGSVAQSLLGGQAFGSFLSINLSWGIAVALGVCVASNISGAHLNPAVTLALAVHRRFAWNKVPLFILAQVLGAFVAAEVVYLTYFEAFNAFDGGMRAVTGSTATAGVFATYPQSYLSTFPGGFIDQFVGTALLAIVLFSFADPRNEKWAKPLAPLLVGLLVAVIGMAFGMNAGYAINPARDFGPRLFTYFAGWGDAVFRAGDHFWWIPIVAPCFGAVAGGFVYDLLMPARASEPAPARLTHLSSPSRPGDYSADPS